MEVTWKVHLTEICRIEEFKKKSYSPRKEKQCGTHHVSYDRPVINSKIVTKFKSQLF